jgi:hypothetical protein
VGKGVLKQAEHAPKERAGNRATPHQRKVNGQQQGQFQEIQESKYYGNIYLKKQSQQGRDNENPPGKLDNFPVPWGIDKQPVTFHRY